MSEKRFVIDEEGISDNKTDKWYCWKEEVVDLLNELSYENNILNKNEDDLKECTIENIKLKEENEQLRNFIELMNMRHKWKLYNFAMKNIDCDMNEF